MPENHFLASLSSRDVAELAPHLSPSRRLARSQVINEIGRPVERVYFPSSGVISRVARMKDGATFETSIIGWDSLCGASGALDLVAPVTEALVQVAGQASTIDAEKFRQ